MKLDGLWRRYFVPDGDGYSLRLTKKQLYIVAGVLLAVVVICLGLGIWGITRQAELVQLRQRTELQKEQLKLLQQKTDILDKKMQTLDQLDQEIRQMVKGSESGAVPQGGGESQTPTAANSDDSADPHGVDNANGGEVKTVNQMPAKANVVALSAKLSSIDHRAQQRMASLFMLRSILRDGAGQTIRDLQQIAFAPGNATAANATMPSIWPAKGVITSTFGGREDPVYGGGAFHEGLDIASDYGTPIVATAAGTVTFAGYTDGGYGNLVEIDHGNGFVTRYGHTSVVLVHAGMKVNQGQQIALMGSTGKSTGSHVHYEVVVNGSAVDPLLFLPIQ